MKRSQPLRRKRKGPDALLTQKCDDAWSQLVKLRTPFCEVCNSSFDSSVDGGGRLEAHQLVSRDHWAVRWNPRCGCTLCWRHHRLWVHSGNVHLSREWDTWIGLHRREDWQHVDARKNDQARLSIPDKQDILASLSEQLQEFRAAA